MGKDKRQIKRGFLSSWWILVLTLIIIPPAGLILLWREKTIDFFAKSAISLIIFLLILPLLLLPIIDHFYDVPMPVAKFISEKIKPPKVIPPPLPAVELISPDEIREGAIYLVPLGNMEDTHIELLDKVTPYLTSTFAYEIKIIKPIPLPGDAFNEERRQWDIARIRRYLKYFAHQLSEDKDLTREAVKIIGVTDADLYSRGSSSNYYFASADAPGKAAIISFHRFGSGEDNQAFLRRAVKQISKSTSHTFGMTHCNNRQCLMYRVNSLYELDTKGSTFCPNCRQRLRILLEINDYIQKGCYDELIEKYQGRDESVGRTLLGIACLRKKQYKKAIEELSLAISQSPENEIAHDMLAEAYWASGQKEDAYRSYKLAVKANPRYLAILNNRANNYYMTSASIQRP